MAGWFDKVLSLAGIYEEPYSQQEDEYADDGYENGYSYSEDEAEADGGTLNDRLRNQATARSYAVGSGYGGSGAGTRTGTGLYGSGGGSGNAFGAGGATGASGFSAGSGGSSSLSGSAGYGGSSNYGNSGSSSNYGNSGGSGGSGGSNGAGGAGGASGRASARGGVNNVINLHPQNAQDYVLVSAKPDRLEDAQLVCNHLKERHVVIVNVEGLEGREAQRIVDFVSGAVYALDGEIFDITNRIFAVAPSHVELVSIQRDPKSRGFLSFGGGRG